MPLESNDVTELINGKIPSIFKFLLNESDPVESGSGRIKTILLPAASLIEP